MTSGPDPSEEPRTAPLHVAPPSNQRRAGAGAPEQPAVQPAIGSSPGDACPNCGAQMALDQRYCLQCGNRRGDPRLPFMDAVAFMEASKQPQGEAAAVPPPPPPAKSGFSPGTTLIAGIATLVLAVGVGVLIGRSGNSGSAPVANQKPTVIQVGGNNNGGEAGEATEATTGGKEAKKSGRGAAKKGKGQGQEKSAAVEEGSNGGSKAAQEVLHTAPGVKEAKPEAAVGESCEKGTAGCGGSGKFDGSFFE
ncbi:MAG TPA: zinc ribbon domain-containing protein [Solirubrobacterales bacterium]